MKANELMIGDLVYCEGQPTPDNVIIQAIHEDGVWFQGEEFEGAASYDRIFPIHLTPEILEKNGWFYPKQSSWMKLDNPHRELWGCIHTDGTLWLYSSGDCDKDESFAEIKYVHELQHTLHICGIEKTIEL